MTDKVFYEERTPNVNFKLEQTRLGYFGVEHPNINVKTDCNALFFLHIKSLDLKNMRMPYRLPQNTTTAKIAYCIIEDNNVVNVVSEQTTTIFTGGTFVMTIDKFVEFLNVTLDGFVTAHAEDDVVKKCSTVCNGSFVLEDNKLYYKYSYVKRTSGKQLAVMSFNNVFLEVILRYFQLEEYTDAPENFYFIRPYRDKVIGDTKLIPAFRDTTEFFYPRFTIDVVISNEASPKFTNQDKGYKTATIPFDLRQSFLEVNSYLLIADKITSELPVSYKMSINISQSLKTLKDMNVAIDAEYIVLKDTFDQFDQFKLEVGYLYSETDYRELSYRKLMGITANTVYLQNASSTEKLAWICARLNMHLPEIGTEGSMWDYIKQLVGEKELIDAIYQLLYNKYPYGPSGPLTKKAKIEF